MNDCDLAIVGGGLAGLSAAVRGAELGKRVIVLERQRDERYLCNTRLSSGVFHFCVTAPRTDPDQLTQKALSVLDESVDAELIRSIACDVGRSISWLQQQGIRFVSRNDPARPHHTHILAPIAPMQLGRQWEGRGGDVMLRTLEVRLQKLGGQLHRGWDAQQLLMEGRSCVGVLGECEDGTSAMIRADAVVLGDGGFQSNREDVKRWICPSPESLLQRNAGTAFGAGLRMAMQAGAAVSDLAGVYGHLHSRDSLVNDALWPYPVLDDVACRYVIVDKSGHRLTDEGRGGIYATAKVARSDDPAGITIVCDIDGWEGKGSPASSGYLAVNPMLEKGGGTVHRASTLRELARKADIDPDGLEQEINRYNQAIIGGTLEKLTPGRSTATYPALPIVRAPFIALPAVPGITYTLGGPLIDKFSRVLDQDRAPITGLYAAGSTSGGLEGYERNGYVGGLIKAVVTGIHAAEHVAGIS